MGKLKTLTAFLVGIVLVTVGFALNTFSATTPPQASDGYYELDSYEDLVWFQQYIDAGNVNINAIALFPIASCSFIICSLYEM